MFMIRGGAKRADYARSHKIYASVGENVTIQSRAVPLYSQLIRIGNNVSIARNVDFCTHDIMHRVFNRLPRPEGEENEFRYTERIGCIEIRDNCFIGSNSVILYDVRIGPNVVVASDSLVNQDCEPNSVYAGVPARRVESFDGLVQRRKEQIQEGTIPTTTHNQQLSQEEILAAWRVFEWKRSAEGKKDGETSW